MGTTILRSQGRFRPETLIVNPPNKFLNPNYTKSRRQKRNHGSTPKESPNVDRRDRSQPHQTPNFPAKNLVMGEVKIMKRGEPLISATRKSDKNRNPRMAVPSKEAVAAAEADLVLGSTDRLGPEPDMVRGQIRVKELKGYAGTGFLASPPPSSLPVPGFLWKRRDA